jgi:hypothetical protein
MLDCKLEVLGPGPFENHLDLFFNDNGLRTVPLTVRGATTPTASSN